MKPTYFYHVLHTVPTEGQRVTLTLSETSALPPNCESRTVHTSAVLVADLEAGQNPGTPVFETLNSIYKPENPSIP